MKPMHEAALAASVSALVLAGCVTATSTAQTPLAADLAEGGFVQEVYVSAPEDSGITAHYAAEMAEELEERLADCATGDRPLRMDVMLTDTKAANPLVAAVMTDTNAVMGDVTIYSLESGQPVGQYEVEWENRGGLGLSGAFMHSAMGIGQVSEGFAKSVCRRAFEGGGDHYESVQLLPF